MTAWWLEAQTVRSGNIAIRSVYEDDDVHVIGGLGFAYGGPFAGGDTYRTHASPDTKFYWELFPDRLPSDPEDVAARYVRPLNYQHGFDQAVGLRRNGGWSPVYEDQHGVWVQAQLDKHDQYYGAIRELLEKDALGFSPESAEHSVRIDRKTGHWDEWPAIALALTPTPSNPWNMVAARTADVITIVQALRKDEDPNVGGGVDRDKLPDEDFAGPDRSFPIVKPGDVSDAASSLGRAKGDRDAIKAAIIRIAKRKGQAFVDQLPEAWKEGGKEESSRSAVRGAGYDIMLATSALTSLAQVRDCEVGEDDQVALLTQAMDLITDFLKAEAAEPLPDIEPGAMPAYMSAIRAGRRHSAADQDRVDAIHDHATMLGATAHAEPNGQPNDDSSPAEEPSTTARSGEDLQTVNIVLRSDPDELRAKLLAEATTVGAETAIRLTSIK